MSMKRKMHLVAYLKTGPTASYASAWRHPSAPLHDIWDAERYENLARLLEEARFDAGFFADGLGLPDIYKNSFADYVGRGGQLSLIDPMTVLPLMARVTRHLGLGNTISTTFNQPYQIARSLGSLDLLSRGRAAWNVVTSATDYEARNCGMDGVPPKADRYDRADDVLEACCALWDCWDPDALVLDRESGVFADASKIRYANHVGPYVRTRGPMSIPRSPQGRPLILQAGSSPRGRECAARWADMIFCTTATKADGIAFRSDMHARLSALGRSPIDCAVLPTLSVVIGETRVDRPREGGVSRQPDRSRAGDGIVVDLAGRRSQPHRNGGAGRGRGRQPGHRRLARPHEPGRQGPGHQLRRRRSASRAACWPARPP